MQNFWKIELKHILLILVMSVLLITYAGKMGLFVGYALLAYICIGIYYRPEIGLLSFFPVLFILPSAPTRINLSVIFYALIVALTFFRTIYEYRQNIIKEVSYSFYMAFMIPAIFIIVNFFVAISSEVAVSAWLRGLAPFLFIFCWLPIFFLVRNNSRLLNWLLISIAVALILFSLRVFQVYLQEQLWEPCWYILNDGEWINISIDEAKHFAPERVGHFIKRVTQVLPQSTDALVPLGIVIGIVGFSLDPRNLVQKMWLGLVAIATAAVILTYSRSMLLACVAVLGLLALIFFAVNSRLLLRLLTGIFVLGLTAFLIIKIFSLEDIYFNRGLQLLYTVNLKIGETLPFLKSTELNEYTLKILGYYSEGSILPDVKDVNVTTRIEEYKVAWNLFLESPVIGKGLGIKHEMKFATGFGNILVQQVGYIHNWFFYMLMVGGLCGLALYLFIIFGPAYFTIKGNTLPFSIRVACICTLAFIMCYGLFFAVFRLISFNLLLASAWGIVMAHRTTADSEVTSCVE